MKTKSNILFYRSLRTVILLTVILSLNSVNSFAGKGKTNFTGKWGLNESTSTLSQGGFGPAKMLNITQEGNNLNIEQTRTNRNGEEQVFTLKYTLDGKECDNSSQRRTSKSVLSWSEDGKVLTINTTSKSEKKGKMVETKSVEIWKLAADGKSIVIEQNVNSSRGERKSILNYEKK